MRRGHFAVDVENAGAFDRREPASWCGKSVEWLDLRLQQGRPLDQAGLATIVRALREHGVKPIPQVLLEAAQPIEPLVLIHHSQVEDVARLIAAEVGRTVAVPDQATLAARLLPLLNSYAAAGERIWPGVLHVVGAHDIEDAARQITEARFLGKPLASGLDAETGAAAGRRLRIVADEIAGRPRTHIPES